MDQADAFAALLDALEIARTNVAAFSAGAASAVQFALCHPGRINHLVVISGYWPGGPTAKAAPQANRLLVRSEFPMWALRTFAGPLLARIAGVPKGFPLTAADARTVTDLTGTFFPVVARAEGVIFDFFVSFHDINLYDLEAITVPVLIIHAADDPAARYDAAQQAADRIPRARLLRVSKGGHLMLGQQETVRPDLAAFLETPAPPKPARRRLRCLADDHKRFLFSRGWSSYKSPSPPRGPASRGNEAVLKVLPLPARRSLLGLHAGQAAGVSAGRKCLIAAMTSAVCSEYGLWPARSMI